METEIFNSYQQEKRVLDDGMGVVNFSRNDEEDNSLQTKTICKENSDSNESTGSTKEADNSEFSENKDEENSLPQSSTVCEENLNSREDTESTKEVDNHDSSDNKDEDNLSQAEVVCSENSNSNESAESAKDVSNHESSENKDEEDCFLQTDTICKENPSFVESAESAEEASSCDSSKNKENEKDCDENIINLDADSLVDKPSGNINEEEMDKNVNEVDRENSDNKENTIVENNLSKPIEIIEDGTTDSTNCGNEKFNEEVKNKESDQGSSDALTDDTQQNVEKNKEGMENDENNSEIIAKPNEFQIEANKINENDVVSKDNAKEPTKCSEKESNENEEGRKVNESQDNTLVNQEEPLGNYSLLKETLTKAKTDDGESPKEGENGDDDIDMDDDFDPSLLCPDIAMEVDEAPVITNNENVPHDGSKSPLLYEPIFSTYVDEMTGAEVSFNLTHEERILQQESYGEKNPVQYTKIHCTACNVHLGSALDGQSNRFVHPLLKVLICKDCYHFYTSGEFEKDEDGSELYCRWCGQGGQVLCCSNCEMVFCKKCIRINFGRKKLVEIRDSEEWMCFRCNTSQLMQLRVHCAEFMEYVRREISRAATLENATSFTTTDYSQCCVSQKKKTSDSAPSEPKRKKRKSSADPDYNPFRDQESPQPSTSGLKAIAPAPPVVESAAQKSLLIQPKPMDPHSNGGIVQVSQNNAVFRVGNTTFKPRSSTFVSQPRPRVQVINPVTSNSGVHPPTSGPGYIKILPGGIRVSPSLPRNTQTFTTSTVRPQFPQPRPIQPQVNNNHQIKHEWFEKTVRAAARVNSNLSYTLTQLSRAQSTATSVEALAVIHNKLQEILSTSINSLIQIRKNLRTEFIAGIKNIRFPPKPQPPQDDDVIFISPTTSPIPPPLVPAPTNSCASLVNMVNLPPSVSLTSLKKTSNLPLISSSVPGTSKEGMGVIADKPRGFLRVKSLTALQNVTSECITIPDDPPPQLPPPLAPLPKTADIIFIDGPDNEDIPITDEGMSMTETNKTITDNIMQVDVNKTKDQKATNYKEEEEKCRKADENKRMERFTYNLKDPPSTEVKKMLSTKVCIVRSTEIDNLIKQKFGHLYAIDEVSKKSEMT